VIFTSESVTPGHPDKLCDQISDAAVDAFLRQDRRARVTVECAISTGVAFIAARFAAEASVDLPSLARSVMTQAGYRGGDHDAGDIAILTSFTDLGVDARAPADGAADTAHEQVNAFGYACQETGSLMPLPIVLAHQLARSLSEAASRHPDVLGPDGKTQVAVEYVDGRPSCIRGLTVMAALRCSDLSTGRRFEEIVHDEIVTTAFVEQPLQPRPDTEVSANPGGLFLRGGPATHAGLTGRKIGIDTYGEYARQSGSALSGKDPSRVDRIGTYAARFAAKSLVAAGFADRCEVHLAYAVGRTSPISISVQSFGTGRESDEALCRRLAAAFDFGPHGLAERFDLHGRAHSARDAGFFRQLAVFGQIGREDVDCPWEDMRAVIDVL
jgi:S-adenosylmethionine synthetase